MAEYQIFDETLSEEYIAELTDEELTVLIDEGQEERLRIEREIDMLVWPDTPQVTFNGEPRNGYWPSQFSYEAALYEEELSENPGLRRKLDMAAELSVQVGQVMAVIGSAKVQQARNNAAMSATQYREDLEKG